MPRSIGSENADLAIVDLADGTAVLAADADRVVAFFDETALVENNGSIGMPGSSLTRLR